MPATAIPPGDFRERIAAALSGQKKPVTFKSLAKLMKAGGKFEAPFRDALEAAVASGEVYRWPDSRRVQYFWHVSPERAAREAILAAAAPCALSKADLSKAASRKLPGYSAKGVEAMVSALVGEKQLQLVPGIAGRAKLLVRTGDRDAYLTAARLFIEKKIRSAGFDPAEYTARNSTQVDKPADAAALILEAVKRLEPVPGVPVSTLRLRNHLPNLAKGEFDAAALELRRNQQVFLSQHTDIWNISGEDKNLLIDGQDGTYYVAIAIR
jgi:hypothetical protein